MVVMNQSGDSMKYCSKCGASVVYKIPGGDTYYRYVCENCGTIHYLNPNLVVGTLPFMGDRILLCKRAIEPAYGLWTLPSGFMENGETVEDGAIRETLEEANARVEITRLHTVYSCSNINHVYLLFEARLLDMNFYAGEESLDVRLFSGGEIPWDDIAFTAVRFALESHYFMENDGEVHMGCAETQTRQNRIIPG